MGGRPVGRTGRPLNAQPAREPEGSPQPPIWAREERDLGTFEARPVSRAGGPSPRLATAVAVAALGALVALGTMSPTADLQRPATADELDHVTPPAPARVARPGRLTRSERGGWPPLRVTGVGPSPVNLVWPKASRAVTSGFVAVRGTVVGRPDEIRIELETSAHVLLGSAVVDTHNVHGGIRPDRTPTIDVRIDLPAHRPEGDRLWLTITAYDSLGALIGAMRRPVDIGPPVDRTDAR